MPRSREFGGWGQGCLTVVVVLFVISLVGQCCGCDPGTTSSSRSSTSSSTNSVRTGEVLTLRKNVTATSSEAAYDAMVDAVIAKDKMGFMELAAQGQLVVLEAGTKVRVLGVHIFGPCKVRVESGDYLGNAVWAAYEHLEGK